MWTRIWWVRPVSSTTRSSVDSRQQPLDLEVGARLARLVGVDRHQHAVAAVAADRRVDRAGARLRPPVDQRQVFAPHAPLHDHLLERAMDGVVLGDDQQPRGVAVKPMDDSGTPRLLAAGAAPGQRLRERAGPVTARRMDDDAGGLVDDQQVLVLVGHRERHVHRFDLGRPLRRCPPTCARPLRTA